MNFKRVLVYFVFLLNLTLTSIYILFDIIGYEFLNNWDLTLILIYDLFTFIVLGEIIKKKNKNR